MTVSSIVDYQAWTIQTAVYPEAGEKTDFELNYLVMGFVGETGELANKLKKLLRKGIVIPGNDKNPLTFDDEQQKALIDEMGDVLWYLARLCETLDIDLVDLAVENRMKLEKRKTENELKDHQDTDLE